MIQKAIEVLSNPWVLFGFAAQFVFFLRFAVQWWVSEKKKESYSRFILVPKFNRNFHDTYLFHSTTGCSFHSGLVPELAHLYKEFSAYQ
jgi:hypothetical protein